MQRPSADLPRGRTPAPDTGRASAEAATAPRVVPPRAAPGRRVGGAGMLLAIQRTVGNQAAIRALAARPALVQRKDPPDGAVAVAPKPAGPAVAPGPALPDVVVHLPDNQPVASPGFKASIFSYVKSAASLVTSAGAAAERGFWDVTNATFQKIWDTAAGMLKGQMTGLGFELSDDQARQLIAVATKQATNMIAPLPGDQVIASLKLKKLERGLNPGTLALEGISLENVEWWIANLVTFQGPTLKVGALGLERINVEIPAKPPSAPGLKDGAPPLSLYASLKLGDLEIQGSGNIVELLADAIFEAMPRGTPDRIDRPESVKEIFVAAMQRNVRERLSGSAKASLKSLQVVVHNLTFGDVKAAAIVSGQNLKVGATVSGGLADAEVSADASGRLSIDDAFVQVAGKSALNVESVAFSLDEHGTGSAVAKVVLHDKGLGKLADSTIVRLFLDKNDPVQVSIPINAYKVMLGGLDFKLPSHPAAAKAAKKLLDIRVTDKETQWLGLRGSKAIEPTLKVSVGGVNKASVTAPQMGVSAPQPADKAVLVPKGTVEGGAEGAVNIQAFVENVVQGKLRAAAAQL
jgi:hypothetical protein